MRRKYLNDLIEWMNDPRRKPLMVSGARQVGKSYLIEELFAKEYYKNKYLKIDLSDDVDFVEFAENNSKIYEEYMVEKVTYTLSKNKKEEEDI